MLLELAGTRVLTDPLLRDRLFHIVRYAPPAGPVGPVDAVLISHQHRDHLDLPSLTQVHPPRVIAPKGAGRYLARTGAAVDEVLPGEVRTVGEISVTAVHADHDGRRSPADRSAAPALGYVVDDGSTRIYFAGDTGEFDRMEDVGPVDVALLPVWGWGVSLGGGKHMDWDGAARATALLRPRIAIPIHWGTYFPAGRAKAHAGLLEQPGPRFAEAVAREAPGTEVHVLRPGDTLAL